MNKITVSDITIDWDLSAGTCSFEDLPVAMFWTDTTLAGLMAGVQSMVGTERFALALQSEGRKSVEADWSVISQFPSFEEGFRAIANIAAVAGWGLWEIVSLDRDNKECVFKVTNNWEAHYQKSLGVKWGSAMLAGKLAGYCTHLFGTNCWAEQTSFAAADDEYDLLRVSPSPKTIEEEIDTLLESDNATKADMAVALAKLKTEINTRIRIEDELKRTQLALEDRVEKRTQESLASEAKFRTIIESSPMGIHMYHLTDHGDLVFSGYNAAANKILGVDHEQFVGKTIEDAFPPLATTEVPQQYKNCCKNNAMWQTQQITYEDNKIAGAFEVYAFQTSPGNMAAFFLDITEKLQKQESIKKLEKSVQQMKNLESLGVLAGGIAHDFNNILTAILGSLSIIKDSLPSDYEDIDLVLEAEKASFRAKDLTQQLLTFSKGGEPIKKTSSLKAVIEDSAQFILLGSAIKVTFNFPDDLWLVEIDKSQISQVIQNIILNAKHAMPSGGTITISAENLSPPLTDTLLLDANEHYIKVSISDQGIGIPDSIKEKIFEPYFSTKQEGSGLGLAITFAIVKKHKGTITVSSRVNEGATFDIYLPKSHRNDLPQKEKNKIIQKDSLTLLIMDDEFSIRKLYSIYGKKMGHKILFAETGEEAIEQYNNHASEIDIVIADLTIPGGMGGKDAAAAILEQNPNARIIVSSGFSNDPILAQYADFGFCGILAKPFRKNELEEAIHKALTS